MDFVEAGRTNPKQQDLLILVSMQGWGGHGEGGILLGPLQAGEVAFPNRCSQEAQPATLGGQHPCWEGALLVPACE